METHGEVKLKLSNLSSEWKKKWSGCLNVWVSSYQRHWKIMIYTSLINNLSLSLPQCCCQLLSSGAQTTMCLKKNTLFFKLNFSVLYGKLIILWPVGHWANLSKNMKNLHNFFLTTANNPSAADLRASTLWTLSYYMSSLKDNYHHLQSLHYITGIHNKTNALDSMK